mgnify:CR=1 FL=1
MTQQELADRVGVSKALIGQIETQLKTPSDDVAQKIKAVFDVMPVLGATEKLTIADLKEPKLKMTWGNLPLWKSEEEIVRNLVKSLIDQRR